MSAQQQYDDLSHDTIAAALSFVDCNDWDMWVRMGMAIKSELGQDGFDIWNNWGKGRKKYSERDARNSWKSIKPVGGVRIGTLIREALQSGYRFDSDTPASISEAEKTARRERVAQQEKAEAAALKVQHALAADLAAELWDEAQPVYDQEHAYLQRKGVNSHGLKLGRWPLFNDAGEIFRWLDDVLLIPIYDSAKRPRSLQGVFTEAPSGFRSDKSYLKGGEKSGHFFTIGTPPTSGAVAVCEGYATGASIHEAMGWYVAVAFDRSNLRNVAETMRKAFPTCQLVVVADNDRFTTNSKGELINPGVKDATAAAAAVNGRLVVPQFTSDDGQPTDINDLHQREGIDAVRKQLAFKPLVPANDDFEPQDVDIYTPFPQINGKGQPLETSTNLRELLNRIGATVRYNVISKRVEILVPGHRGTKDNYMHTATVKIADWCKQVGFPTGGLESLLLAVADETVHNPVVDWVTSRPWDGVSRIRAFFDTITTPPGKEELRDLLMRRWMISAIAGAFSPIPVKVENVLTLVGAQGKGKTSWFKRLVGDLHELAADGLMLNPSDKDSQALVIQRWLVELGEIDATFRRADISSLKQWLSRTRDDLRMPYARASASYARRTVFFASVNEEKFLHDPTGNRRWWTIPCIAINYLHGLDMQQVWAEFLHLYESGEAWYLSREEDALLSHSNTEYEAITPIHEMIDSTFDWSEGAERCKPMTATEICQKCGIVNPTKNDVNSASAYVKKQYEVQAKRVGSSKLTRLLMPPRIVETKDNERPY